MTEIAYAMSRTALCCLSRRSRRRRPSALIPGLAGVVLIGGIAGFAPAAARAGSYTWSGINGTNWSDPGNWMGGVPSSGATTSLLFNDAASNGTSNNDIDNFVLNSIQFASTLHSYTLGGKALTFAANGSVTPNIYQNSYYPVTIGNALNWSSTTLTVGVPTIIAGTPLGTVTLSGVLTGTDGAGHANLTKVGNCEMDLTGTGSSLTGLFTIEGGQVQIPAGASLTPAQVTISNGEGANIPTGLIVSGGTLNASTYGIQLGNGTSASITVNSGGTLIGGASIGYGSGAATLSASVDGAGSTWTAGGITLGLNGAVAQKNSVSITNGGTVNLTSSLTDLSIGYAATTLGSSTVTVDGAGSTLTAAGTIYLGASVETASQGTLSITNGGTLSAAYIYEYGDGSPGLGIPASSILVSGAGSSLSTSYYLFGQHNFTVSNLATANIRSLNVGGELAGTATTTIDNATLTTGAIEVDSAASATLTVRNAAVVSNSELYLNNYSTAGTSTILVDGSRTVFNNSNVSVGANSTITVRNGAKMTGFVTLGNSSVASNTVSGTVNIDGAGTVWDAGNASGFQFEIGANNKGILNITNGATALSRGSYIGDASSSQLFISTATIDGAGSVWTNSGDLSFPTIITSSSAGGQVNITNGGLFNSGTVTMATNGSASIIAANGGTLATKQLTGAGTLVLSGSGLTLNLYGTGSQANSVFTGTIKDGASAGSLTKTGSATLTLSTASTFTGGTTIAAGTIAAKGTSLGTGVVTLLNGATLSPGAALNTTFNTQSTGNLSISSLIWNAGGLITFNLGTGNASDSLTTSSLAFSGSGAYTVAFGIASGSAVPSGTFTLMTVNSAAKPSITPTYTTSGGNIASLNSVSLNWQSGGASVWKLILSESGGVAATPEPNALALLVIGWAGAASRIAWRRRWRK